MMLGLKCPMRENGIVMWMWNAPSSRGRRIELSSSETGITSITIAGDKCRSDAERGDSVDTLIEWRSLLLEKRVDRGVGCGLGS